MYFWRIFIVVASMCLALGVRAANEVPLPPTLEAALSYAKVPKSSISLIVQPLDDSSPVINLNPDVARNPASTTKILTTYAALELLSPAYRWKTKFYLQGELSDGVLKGDLAIKGFGDPFLALEDVWRLLRELKRKGITKIDGDLILDDSYFSVTDEDRFVFDGEPDRSYNLAPSALLLNFQSLRLVFNDNGSTVDVYTDPHLPNLRIINRLKTKPGACRGYNAGIAISVAGGDARNIVQLDGEHPKGCTDYSMVRNVLKPDSYFFGLFKSMWLDLGGDISGSYKNQVLALDENAEPFMTWYSRPFREVLTYTNKYSNNTMTRNLLLTIAAEEVGEPGTTMKGIEVVKAFLADRGIATDSLILSNGAGLSRDTRMSAQLIVDTLVDAYQSPNAAEFIASLPLNGIDGTMRERLKGKHIKGTAHLKTGRLDDVIALAGIIQADDNKRYALAFMINHKDIHKGTGVDIGDALIRWLYKYSAAKPE